VRSGRRTLAGRLLLVGGGLAVLLGGADWADGAVARSRARTLWDAREAVRAVAAARASVDAVTLAAPAAPGTPIARLLAPSIGLDEVVVEGVGSRELNAGPGHMPETPLPGEPGNAAISAHRDRHFARAGALAVGDLLVTETDAGRTTWRIIFPTRDATLTLTTCWPIRWFGPAPRRLVITAKPEPRR